MELPLSQLSAALTVCARRTASSHYRSRSVSRAFAAARRDQQSPQFKKRMLQRKAIEGRISELARAHGLRRSRYRGFAKVKLQNLFIGTACNIKRCCRSWRRPKSTSYFFKNVLQRVQGVCGPLRIRLIFFSCPIRGVTFLTPA
jgi:hypothetical protein